MFGLTPYGKKNALVGKFEDPFKLDNFFENIFNDQLPFYSSNQLKVDISENEKEYVIEAELPGYRKEEISIDLDEDRLTIAAEKNQETEEKGEHYLRRERRFGSLTRSFLVRNINKQAVGAKYENGVLTVVLPKMEPEAKKGTKIEID
ncbi:Hsp20/alpha crystallin family protein [Candidatus Formimonas warabiya]|uniref:Heat-shock protein Hsp20 n=1 Tax=Formimonas warabiya TaxID=1761012 RepID=A0A3G1KNG0_FORW1|nr:Hsp20/alpha crystallin family protein [Candidatus Formimonas warabiya]ATW24002.1 heat-shock protein Hsp20 [Candidatus Formimonas warabiya]